jgi:hypothetical protein
MDTLIMKIKFTLLLLMFSFGSGATDITIESKHPTTCSEIRSKFSQDAVVVNCESLDLKKLKFFSASYVGKKPLRVFIQGKKGKLGIENLFEDKKIKLVQ